MSIITVDAIRAEREAELDSVPEDQLDTLPAPSYDEPTEEGETL